MPLHEWTGRGGWEGMHHLWITELLRWVKPRLPEGYRAYIGTAPLLAIGAPTERPDVAVRAWPNEGMSEPREQSATSGGEADEIEPDLEVAVPTLDPDIALFVERQGRLVSAVELVSPRNKDRPIGQAAYLARYAGYLLDGVHLMLIDVHRRPLNFSFADQIAAEMVIEHAPCPSPYAVSYRVGEPAASGGRLLAIWRRQLGVDAPLPTLPLPLTVEVSILVDLEQTYSHAATDVYLP